MEKIKHEKLYQLQDKVLRLVNSVHNDFYLTGGTALNRFICQKNTRHSDDLDFFISHDENNSLEQMKIIATLIKDNYETKIEISNKDFIRLIIKNQEQKLQIDLVRDIVKKQGDNQIINNYTIDNSYNILTNKISAILDRDEEKDIYDLFLLNEEMDIDWVNAIEDAQKKSHFQAEDFFYRIKTFPLNLLDNIKTENHEFINKIKNEYDNFCYEVEYKTKEKYIKQKTKRNRR